MKLKSLIKLRYGSIRRCAEDCDIPYATLHDICTEKADLMQCTCQTAVKLARGLEMTVDELLRGETLREYRDMLHNERRTVGDMQFLLRHLQVNEVYLLWETNQKAKALYLLAMIDFLCQRNGIPIVENYNNLRKQKLARPVFVGDAALDKVSAMSHALEAFSKYNIVEGTVDDAV